MGIAMFYHLTHSTAEDTLRMLLGRAMGMGWRVMVRGTDPAALAHLDAALWQDPDDSFLPHGVEGGPHDAEQPVLIGRGAIANAASGLFLIDSAGVTVAEAQALERVWLLFDAANPDTLAAARGQWKTLTDAGVHAQYWSEESGRWEKKSEKNAPGQ